MDRSDQGRREETSLYGLKHYGRKEMREWENWGLKENKL